MGNSSSSDTARETYNSGDSAGGFRPDIQGVGFEALPVCSFLLAGTLPQLRNANAEPCVHKAVRNPRVRYNAEAGLESARRAKNRPRGVLLCMRCSTCLPSNFTP